MKKQEKTFKKLKERFTKEPVLAVLDWDKKMRMKVDVCCGNHLSQRQMITQAVNLFKLDIKWEVSKRTRQGVSA